MSMNTVPHGKTSGDFDAQQMIVFSLGKDQFCVDIKTVREINRMVKVTSIPQSPEYLLGVINLRGNVLPVVDMRRRFGYRVAGDPVPENRIMVVETPQGWVGYVVDSVREVVRLQTESIQDFVAAPPTRMEKHFIKGVAEISHEHIVIIDPERAFAQPDLRYLQDNRHSA